MDITESSDDCALDRIAPKAALRIAALEIALRKIWHDTRGMDDDLLIHLNRIAERALGIDSK